jgi:hypothetical protein
VRRMDNRLVVLAASDLASAVTGSALVVDQAP